MTVYTYSKLGNNGAAGNQLWEIAGTIGTAIEECGSVRLPEWYYKKYFTIPESYFDPIPQGEEVVDLAPDYLQDLRLWFGCDEVHEALTFSMYSWERIYRLYEQVMLLDTELIAVHVRRGNNLQLPNHHPVCSLDYFEEALDMMGEGQVFVFSDDLDWCKSQSLFKDAVFAEGNDPKVDVSQLTGAEPLFLDSVMTDLAMMAQCDKHIISNSSFSWWGAYLSYSSEIIYPARWYGPALQHINTSVMFPKNWKKLDA